MHRTIPLLVASFNRRLANFPDSRCEGPGLALCAFDPDSGSIEMRAHLSGIDNPGFVAFHPGHRCAYAVTEVHDWEEGVVTSVRVAEDGAALVYLNKQPSLGNCTAHCSLDRSGRFLLAANYRIGAPDVLPGMSVAVFPIREDGSLSPPSSAIRLSGSGPVAARQEQAHAHCVLAAPDNRHVLVADLGGDAVHRIPFDEGTGLLSGGGMTASRLPGGSGPRHMLFNRQATKLYVLNELAGTLAWLDSGADGSLLLAGIVSTRRRGAGAPHDASDLVLAPDGRFLYAANRGDDTIAIFAVADDGTPSPTGHVSTHGRCPRNLAMSPDGRFLLVANQNSDEISVFEIDHGSGDLIHRRNTALGTPMCIRFMEES